MEQELKQAKFSVQVQKVEKPEKEYLIKKLNLKTQFEWNKTLPELGKGSLLQGQFLWDGQYTQKYFCE